VRRIFGYKRDEAIGGRRKWFNEELQNLTTLNITILIRIRRGR
jgi:hypothetical protein